MQGRDDSLADFLGKSRYIVRRAIEGIAPQLGPRRCVDKADCNANAFTDALQAALHNKSDTKTFSDFRGIGRELSDGHRGIAVNDEQAGGTVQGR